MFLFVLLSCYLDYYLTRLSFILYTKSSYHEVTEVQWISLAYLLHVNFYTYKEKPLTWKKQSSFDQHMISWIYIISILLGISHHQITGNHITNQFSDEERIAVDLCLALHVMIWSNNLNQRQTLLDTGQLSTVKKKKSPACRSAVKTWSFPETKM